jgi:glucose/arabinose dehydrogenase
MFAKTPEIPSIRDESSMRIETVSSGQIKFPTSMTFLAPDDILVLEKNTGTVKRNVNGTAIKVPLIDVNVATKNERGLLGIAVATKHPLSPNYKEDMKTRPAKSTHVFLYFTESEGEDGADVTNSTAPLGNRLYKYELSGNKLVNPKLLLDIGATPYGNHNGGKIIIGPDNNVYLVVGDMERSDYETQNFKNGKTPNGSAGILRVKQDGKEADAILG